MYENLSDEDKLDEAIKFLATDLPIPPDLEAWLRDVGLWQLLVHPTHGDSDD